MRLSESGVTNSDIIIRMQIIWSGTLIALLSVDGFAQQNVGQRIRVTPEDCRDRISFFSRDAQSAKRRVRLFMEQGVFAFIRSRFGGLETAGSGGESLRLLARGLPVEVREEALTYIDKLDLDPDIGKLVWRGEIHHAAKFYLGLENIVSSWNKSQTDPEERIHFAQLGVRDVMIPFLEHLIQESGKPPKSPPVIQALAKGEREPPKPKPQKSPPPEAQPPRPPDYRAEMRALLAKRGIPLLDDSTVERSTNRGSLFSDSTGTVAAEKPGRSASDEKFDLGKPEIRAGFLRSDGPYELLFNWMRTQNRGEKGIPAAVFLRHLAQAMPTVDARLKSLAEFKRIENDVSLKAISLDPERQTKEKQDAVMLYLLTLAQEWNASPETPANRQIAIEEFHQDEGKRFLRILINRRPFVNPE